MSFGQRANEELIIMKDKQLSKKEPNVSLALERVLIQGDLSSLSVDDRLMYVNKVAKSIGINPLLRPFDYITYHGKTVLYANRACAEQLRMKYGISIKITNREKSSDVYIVTAQAITKSGRTDEAIGAISIRGLTGEALANALLKCETKAKRRVTLSICGLGLIDEIEANDVAEREAKQEDSAAVITVQEKIALTTERPEFEETETQAHPEQEPREHQPEYILRAGKFKGKKISQLTEKQIKNWLSFYEKITPGSAPNPDIEADYREILAFNDEKKMVPDVPNN